MKTSFSKQKIKYVQECIDFCFKHNIIPMIKVVTANDLGAVFKELQTKNDSIVR